MTDEQIRAWLDKQPRPDLTPAQVERLATILLPAVTVKRPRRGAA